MAVRPYFLSVPVLAAALLLTVWEPAVADPFRSIRIGDDDGFGFVFATRYLRANRTGGNAFADVNRDGFLGRDEYLPDLDEDGIVAWPSNDDFDNRSNSEIADRGHTCDGCLQINERTRGSRWTDLALSASASGYEWPDEDGPLPPNNATFVFDFKVAKDDIPPGAAIYFNLVFGDYDVNPAVIVVSFAHEPERVLRLENQGRHDGLIQGRSAFLEFDEVFTEDADGNWAGFVHVVFDAPLEPFTAFDFVELSLFQMVEVPGAAKRLAFAAARAP